MLLFSCLTCIGYYIFGGCFDQLMIGIAKVSIGRLRPHFIDICKPDILIDNSCPTNEYITDYKCTNTNNYYVRDGYMSFFSGHAAFSFYAAWFTSVEFLDKLQTHPVFFDNSG